MPVARLLIADCYFREGGRYNISKAGSEYNSWLDSFPDHKLAPFVMRKVIETHLSQLGFNDDYHNDDYHIAGANTMLLKLQDSYPQYKDDPLIQEYLMVVQEWMANHHLNVARFYFEHRHVMEAARLRCQEVIKKYPQFTKLDFVLWISAQVEEAEDNRDKAIEYCKRIAREYPDSEYRDEAIEKLKYLGSDVPEPDFEINALLGERTLKAARIFGDIGTYARNISPKGVMLDEKDELENYNLIKDSQK
jgi:outer membrane protein assembly factor BamD